MSKHTPGPWKYAKHQNWIICNGPDELVAETADRYSTTKQEANTRVIAAVPNLIEDTD